MKQWFALFTLALALGALPAGAQSSDDQYVGIYNLIQQADRLAVAQPVEALAKYLSAQSSLQRLQKLNPDWNPKVINFRLNYLAEKISELPSVQPESPEPVTPPAPAKSQTATPVPAAAEAKTAPVPETERQIRGLQDDVRRLQADKAILEAKVREALATQPAAIDPRELVKAQDKIQALLKENELLKASAAPAPGPPAPAAASKEMEETQRALADARRQLAEQSARVTALDTDKEALQKQLAGQTAATEGTNNPARLRQALQDAQTRLAEQTAAVQQLTMEQAALQQRVNELSYRAGVAGALRAENELLKQQLAQLHRIGPSASQVEESRRRLAEAESRLAALQSDTQILQLEKTTLEARLKTASALPVPAPASREADQKRIKQLAAERDTAQKQLAAAKKPPSPASDRALTGKVEKLSQEVTGLRARLNVFEARAVPYTAEELALFKSSAPQPIPADSPAGKQASQQLPAGATALAAEAQRHYAAREYDQAETKYRDILRQDEKNIATLTDLARVQIENQHFAEAETNILRALAAAPDDGYSLFILGYLKFQQEKYAEALDPLSRAAKINPNSAEIQNCLGVTLNHQGLRGPAETAFRKAIQLAPADRNAHNNLAVLYAVQTPPLVELARWHYQKALAAGQPKNRDLEKILEPKAAAPAAK